MDIEISRDVFILIIVIAFVAVIQFYKGRRWNLILIEYSARKLEEILQPRDKIYQWIGLYVGYRAVFKLLYKSLNRAEVTVTLLPRQSLFYYPISLITSRFDKIFIMYWFDREFIGEAHVVRKGYYRLGVRRAIKNYDRMRANEIMIAGIKFYIIYNNPGFLRKIIRFIETLEEPGIINHVAIVPENKTLYIAARLKPQWLEDLLRKSYNLAKSLA